MKRAIWKGVKGETAVVIVDLEVNAVVAVAKAVHVNLAEATPGASSSSAIAAQVVADKAAAISTSPTSSAIAGAGDRQKKSEHLP